MSKTGRRYRKGKQARAAKPDVQNTWSKSQAIVYLKIALVLFLRSTRAWTNGRDKTPHENTWKGHMERTHGKDTYQGYSSTKERRVGGGGYLEDGLAFYPYLLTRKLQQGSGIQSVEQAE